MTSAVSFDPCTCDPLGEGEALAEAITGAVFDRGVAIQVLFEAAKCLGAEFVRIDEIVGNDIVDALYENSAWREHLAHALKLAEELVEVDAARALADKPALYDHRARSEPGRREPR